MSSNVEDAIVAGAACVILCRRHRRVKRRFWVRPSLKAREIYSGIALLTDLKRDDLDPSSGDIKCDGTGEVTGEGVVDGVVDVPGTQISRGMATDCK
ncbi:unnamed protein product [Acanthoscelides obtectus]|uniref:Uncharacterized protein n=1 Tax=Acanthoscelides obtectus TaxID=200917 RepID=A0A9P0KYW6_ACAOB|nr:unnamed protein product [Acanthoscelides obtectus]CAK1641955.1 hypothetical protein AOBTE_LOCUS12754 [Acanthoscelides obtectus]